MQALEPDPAVIPFPASEGEAPTAKGNYEAVRFNAMKHGILSRYTVHLRDRGTPSHPHELALVEEHQPAGATEAHLVEELAAIIWRKRRVLVAEGAAINRGLLEVARDSHDRAVRSAKPDCCSGSVRAGAVARRHRRSGAGDGDTGRTRPTVSGRPGTIWKRLRRRQRSYTAAERTRTTRRSERCCPIAGTGGRNTSRKGNTRRPPKG